LCCGAAFLQMWSGVGLCKRDGALETHSEQQHWKRATWDSHAEWEDSTLRRCRAVMESLRQGWKAEKAKAVRIGRP
jgi:hypothetical protein